jgi:hypothetical protein
MITKQGRILNRFSKDIGTIDELLPFTLFDTVEVFFSKDISQNISFSSKYSAVD